MAPPDISDAVSLFNKAFDLESRGHVARVCELRARALSVSKARGSEDCLIVAMVQLDITQQSLWLADRPITDRGEQARILVAAVQPWQEVAAVLQRRYAAGTLLAGACRPAEVAWHVQTSVHISRSLRERALVTTADETTALAGPLVGYEALLVAADMGLYLFFFAGRNEQFFTAAQQHAVFTLAALAAEEMSKPHPWREKFGISNENVFAKKLDLVARTEPFFKMENAGAFAKLLQASCRLLCSGFMTGHLKNTLEQHKGMLAYLDSAEAAASVAPGLRSCALAGCGAKEAHPQHFKSCAACRGVVYCCKEHQTADWPAHKPACKAARKAKAESQAGSNA